MPCSGGEPVHADLAGDVAVGGADSRLGRAVVKQRGSGRMRPDRLLQFGDEAVVPAGEDFLCLGGKPIGIGLGRLAVGLVGPGVDRAVADEILVVERHAPLQDEAVGGASQCQRRTLGLRDFTADLAVIELGGLAEVGQQVGREVMSVPAFSMVFRRGDLNDGNVHGCRLLFVFQGR